MTSTEERSAPRVAARLVAIAAAFAPCAAAQGSPAADAVPEFPSLAWHAPGQSSSWRGPLACHDGWTYRGGAVLEALDVRSGERAAAAAAAGPWLDPVLGGGIVFARHKDGSVHAFAPKLDRELWQVPLQPGHFPGTCCGDMFLVASGTEVVAVTGGAIHWRKDLGEDIEMTPAADGTRVYVGTVAGRIVALELAAGTIAWERAIGAPFSHSDPVVDHGVLFLADRGRDGMRRGALNALTTSNGELQWQTVFGATGFSKPFPCAEEVWGGFGITVARFDRATGKLDREHAIRTGKNPFGRPGVAGDAIVFGNLDGSLYVHDRASGALRWRFEVGGGDQVDDWCLHRGVLVVGSTRGLWGLVPAKEPPTDGVLRAPGK